MKKYLTVFIFLFFACNTCLADEVLNLDKSVDLALNNNYAVIAAKQKVNAAEGALGVSRSTLLPQLTLSGNLNRQYQSPSTFRFTVGGVSQTVTAGINEPANITNYNMTLTQPIFTFGKLMSGVDIAVKNLEIEKQNLRGLELDTIYQAIYSYYSVLKSKKFIDVAQESKDMARNHLVQVEAMFKQGMVTKADILRVEVQESKADQYLIKSNNGFEVSKSVFNTAIGRNIDEPVDLEMPKLDISDKNISLKKMTEEMLFYNPDWIKYNLSKQINENTLSIAVKDYLPTFAFSSSYGWASTDYKYTALQYGVNSWNMTVAGSWNIFTGFKTQSNIEQAKANLDAVIASIENLKRNLKLNIKQAYLEMVSSKDEIKAAGKSLELSRENLRLAELKYKSGMGTNIEVMDAQTEVTQAEVDLTSAYFDFFLAKEKINKIVGYRII